MAFLDQNPSIPFTVKLNTQDSNLNQNYKNSSKNVLLILHFLTVNMVCYVMSGNVTA